MTIKILFPFLAFLIIITSCKKKNDTDLVLPQDTASYITFKEREKAFNTNKLDNFFGVSAAYAPTTTGLLQQVGVSWARTSISWNEIEPTQGNFNWTALDALITSNNAQGIRTLLMLRNTPPWAAITTPYNFICHGISKQSPPNAPSPQHWFVTPIINPSTGFPNTYKVDKKTLSGVLIESLTLTTSDLRMRDVNLWVNFVHKLVARYSVAPYNCKYIQLMNEHRPEAQFPCDNVTNVAQYWFVPAAQDIHNSFPDVKVMNCWPTNVRDEEIEAFDNVPGVLNNLDIYAQHYGDILRWQKVFNTYAAKGKPNMSFWATEYGSTSTTTNPWKISHSYPSILSQCLQQQWNTADKFKLFWYPFSSNMNPPEGLFANATTMTKHGEQVRTIYSLLYGNKLEHFADYSANPDPNSNDYISAFETDRGYVVAIGLLNWIPANNQIQITLPNLQKSKIKYLRCVDAYGKIIERPISEINGNGVSFKINTSLLPEAGMEMLYIEIQTN